MWDAASTEQADEGSPESLPWLRQPQTRRPSLHSRPRASWDPRDSRMGGLGSQDWKQMAHPKIRRDECERSTGADRLPAPGNPLPIREDWPHILSNLLSTLLNMESKSAKKRRKQREAADKKRGDAVALQVGCRFYNFRRLCYLEDDQISLAGFHPDE